MTTIQFDSLVLPEIATSGWLFNNLVDWYTLTDDKAQSVERPQGHGAFAVNASWRSAAAVSFRAVYRADTYAQLLAAHEQLTAIGATGPVKMTVTDDLRATSRTVTVRSSHVPDSHRSLTLEFDVDCLARDPRRYGDPVPSITGLPTSGTGLVFPLVFPVDFGTPGDPGRIEMINLGTAPTSPTFTVTGGLGSFTLLEITSGRRLSFNRVIPVGSSVTLNSRTRRAVIDNQSDVTGFMSSQEWWSIPPSTTSVVQFSGTSPVGSPTLTGVVESAWW